MNVSGLIGLVFILLFIGLIIVFAVAGRRRAAEEFRAIPAFTHLRKVIGMSVEAGSRLHLSIGRGRLIGSESMPALVGLSIQERMARASSFSDNPPVTTTGDAALAILAEDNLKGTLSNIGLVDSVDASASQLSGLTPYSYVAGVLPVIQDGKVSANVLIGNFGAEAAYLTDAGERTNTMTMAGTDNLTGQAVIFGTAHEPLIGEELFAGGAYLNTGPAHTASLKAQDLIRWLIVGVILTGVVLKILGVDMIFTFLEGVR